MKYNYSDEVKGDVVGRTCSIHEEEEYMGFWWETQMERDIRKTYM
jgi:hypothetical protein